ncbi:magnesium-translocating P-type ATPase [Spiroplasma endosymbiont of Stenodema calcarata]|uniref:magnesium-translocating P-type ATPase n=1 Tax=Spiroplasma endosymbiont of Stenodema calcarata TaxID=3139328 RepID=UPI003CCAAC9A
MKKLKQQFNETEIFAEYKTLAQSNLPLVIANLPAAKIGYNNNEVNEYHRNTPQSEIKPQQFKWLKNIFLTFVNPFNLLLIFIFAFELGTFFVKNLNDTLVLASAVIIAIMMTLSATISLVQDYKAFRTTKELQQLVKKTSMVIREGKLNLTNMNETVLPSLVAKAWKIESKKLIPGDLIYLSTGDIVPSDVRIIYTKNLSVNQAVLNGEGAPIYKTIIANPEPQQFFDLSNLCFMGSSVVAGSAIAVVLKTGINTYLGALNVQLTNIESENNFSFGIKKITKLIILIILIMVPIVLVLNGIRTGEWLDALILAFSVAVGLTPESLPVIVAANLTRGSKNLSKEKVVIKQLDAVQNLGAIDVLCTDKTGTLTEDTIELQNYHNINKINDPKVLTYSYLNSYFQLGMKNQIDEAIISYRKVNYTKELSSKYQLLDELPFDFMRRRVSVLVKAKANSEQIMITKGAIEEMLELCTQYEINDEVLALDKAAKLKIIENLLLLNQQGMRLIAIAYKPIKQNEISLDDENNLIFLGFLSFTDVIKKDVQGTLKLLNKYGVTMKILTGDTAQTTATVCEKINLKSQGILVGEEIENMRDDQLIIAVEKHDIFAKLTPLQKARIIEALQKNKHKVGYMGDGINDALALRKSDVAISVNNATDIAKEASDIILLEKSLLVLEQGIIEGRSIFANIIKYLKVTVAANFGLMLSLLIASAWLSFAPMAPIQILFQNLLFDFSQVAVVFDTVNADYIKKPRSWDTKGIISFTLWNGPSVTLMSVLNFVVMGIVLTSLALTLKVDPSQGNNEQLISQFQTTMFTEGALLHMLMIFFMRTNKLAFWKDCPPLQLVLPILFILILIFALPYIPNVNMWLQLSAPPPIWYAFLGGAIVLFALLSIGLKAGYRKVYNSWL